MKKLLVLLTCVVASICVSQIAFAQNATETAVPDDTPDPTPTLDPDDVAMELPGLPPLPDPATLETTSNARTPREPRSARDADRETVLPAVARDTDERALPKNGVETRTYGSTGLVLVGAGLALVLLAWKLRRQDEPAVVIDPPPDDDAPPWGTDSLIGW